MQIHIRANNIELTPAIKDYAEKKVRGLEKYAPKDSGATELQAWVELGLTTKHHQSGNIFKAEVQFQLPHVTNMVRASAETGDLYSSIDKAHDDMKNELSRIREKRISSVKRGAQSIRDFFLGFGKK